MTIRITCPDCHDITWVRPPLSRGSKIERMHFIVIHALIAPKQVANFQLQDYSVGETVQDKASQSSGSLSHLSTKVDIDIIPLSMIRSPTNWSQ